MGKRSAWWRWWGCVILVCCGSGRSLADVGDDFDDNFKNPAVWAADVAVNTGTLAETNSRVEFRSDFETGIGEEGEMLLLVSAAARPWQVAMPTARPWSIEVDAHVDHVSPETALGSVAWAGLFAVAQFHVEDAWSDWAAVGLSLSASRDDVGVFGRAVEVDQADTLNELLNFAGPTGAKTNTDHATLRLRLAFDPADGLLRSSYTPLGGDTFTMLSAIDLFPEGGTAGRYLVGIHGAVWGAAVPDDGSVRLDNFNTIPEPASGLLLAVAGLTRVRCRRR